jgi:hypothetical protein
MGNMARQEQLGLKQNPAATGGGLSALPFKAEMEAAFGEDFSDLKVYLGRKGAMRGMDAGAAAQGNVLVFDSPSPSKEQVAHELTHVVQQKNGSMGGSNKGVSNPQSSAEGEASSVASAVARGEKANVQGSAGPEIHRDFLGIGNALGDAFDMREDEERLDAEEELAEFRERSFSPLTDWIPPSGYGMFDASYSVQTGLQITLKVGYNFVNGDAAAVSPGFRPEEFQWTQAEQDEWKARYQRDVSAQWSARYSFTCTRPYWSSLVVPVNVSVVEDSADPHYVLTVSKYPADAGMAQSSICDPGTHHAGGGMCDPNVADASGNTPNNGTGALDNNDLRPEQKLDWGNASVAIPFRRGRSTMTAQGTAALQPVIDQLNTDNTARVELTGHSSNTHASGSDATQGAVENMDLARARCSTVKTAVEGAGISNSRVQVRNVGEEGAGAGDEWCRVDAQVGNHEMQNPGLHETGHMFGLGDEYPQDGAPAGTAVDAGYDAMVRSTTGQVLTRARNESAMSVGSTVQPWHYSSFMAALRTITGIQEWRV